MSSNSIKIVKNGSFYNVYEDNAIIFNYLFKYKIIGYKVGFPLSALSKVINTLEDKSINYQLESDKEKVYKNYGNKNKYNRILRVAKECYDNKEKINTITDKLNNLDKEKLNNLLNLILKEVDNV